MAESEYSIAIIGVAGRFPEADNVDEFWKNLKEGKDCIHRDTSLDKPNVVGAYGKLENIGEFDAEFFEITPKEAVDSDPEGRIMLELTQHLLENAGCSNEKYKGKTGLYISFDNGVYVWNNIMRSGHNWFETYQMSKVYLATRCEKIAYKFGFEGPAVMSEYACASSINAIHQACQSLLNYECDMALAGGITAETQQDVYYSYLNTTSNKGKMRPFDKNADGLIPGSAATLLALKRYEDAIEEHDNIIAIIRGTFVNNDGNRKAGFAAPSVTGQMNCFESLLSVSETEPSEVDYIEAHGTATDLGDSIEARALKNVIGKRAENNKVLLGSVKSNIGHTNMASGASNVIKAALMLKNRMLVPTLHFEEPCEELSGEDCPIRVCTECQSWTKEKQLIAVASAVGLGGANAMALLAEYIPDYQRKEEDRSKSQLMLISGKTSHATKKISQDLTNIILEKNIRLDDMAYTLQYGRNDYDYRTYIIASGNTPDSIQRRRIIHYKRKEKRNIVFVFSGAGNFQRTIGKEFYHSNSSFRMYMDECFEIAQTIGVPEMKKFYMNFSSEQYEQSANNVKGILLLFSIGYALAKTLMDLGIKPDGVMGHSNGEYIAAAISGILTPENAMYMLKVRQELIDTLPEGAMINVMLSADEVEKLLIDGMEIGAINAPGRTMVAGIKQAADKFEEILKEHDVIYSKMNVNRAGHCYLMDELTESYREKIEHITFGKETIRIISTSIPYMKQENGVMWETEYWVKQMREQVQFYHTVCATDDENKSLFIEIGVSDTLTAMIRKMKFGKDAMPAFAVFDSPTATNARDGFLGFAGELWCNGITIDWEKLYEEKPYKVPLSNYPFERKTYWNYVNDIELCGTNEAEQNDTRVHTIDQEATGNHRLAQNETEKKMLAIVKDVLGYDVHPEDNLYEYGMDSLMAMMISSKVRVNFELDLKLSDMYHFTTVREISDYLLSGQVDVVRTEKKVENRQPKKKLSDLFHEL